MSDNGRQLELGSVGTRIHNPVFGPALRAMRSLNAEADSTLVIGDSPADIMMGRAAGAHTAAALWGGASPERLLAQAPDFAFESPLQLLELLSPSLD